MERFLGNMVPGLSLFVHTGTVTKLLKNIARETEIGVDIVDVNFPIASKDSVRLEQHVWVLVTSKFL